MQLSESDAIKLREDGYDWLKMARILKHRELVYLHNSLRFLITLH